MTAKKVVAYAIGLPVLIPGLLMLVPVIVFYVFLETIKWAVLNIGGDHTWGDY